LVRQRKRTTDAKAGKRKKKKLYREKGSTWTRMSQGRGGVKDGLLDSRSAGNDKQNQKNKEKRTAGEIPSTEFAGPKKKKKGDS